MSETYTVLVMPDEAGGKVRRLQVSGRVVRSAWGLGFIAAAILVVGIVGLAVGFKSTQEQSRLRAENAEYQVQLNRVNAMADNLAGQLVELKATESRLKKLYHFGVEDPAAAKVPSSANPVPEGATTGLGGRGGPEGGDPSMASPAQELYFVDRAAAAPGYHDSLSGGLWELTAEAEATLTRLDALEARLESASEELRHIPSISPVDGWISSSFGNRTSPFTGTTQFHDGLDIVATIGEPVWATADGVVRFAGNANGMGLMVEIDHGQGLRTRYGHSQRLYVRSGQRVVRGQKVATVGMTGNTTGPHVHYEVVKNLQPMDPMDYVAQE